MSQVHISDIMCVDALQRHIEDGNISVRTTDGLSVYKYSKVLPYRGLWDEVTTQCRGLIVDSNGFIVARGFDKFFNHNEPNAGTLDLDAPGVIMDKVDGSLGIVFRHNGRWVVSTAGSLDSDQAVRSTEVFNRRYADTPVVEGMSILVEIIYPDNRIVTDYGDMDDLVLLGGMMTDGTYVYADNIRYDGPRVNSVRGTLREALDMADPMDGSEGFIIRQDNGVMVKMKHRHYLALHKARFSIGPVSVFEAIASDSVDEYVALIPDEFYNDFTAIKNKIVGQMEAIENEVNAYGSQIPVEFADDRKARAQWVGQNVPDPAMRGMVMSRFVAGKDIREGILRSVRRKIAEKVI